MTGQQKKQETTIAPHYYLIRDQFDRLREKLEKSLVPPATLPIGWQGVDPKAALMLWEKGLRRTERKLTSLFHSFSFTILARPRSASYSEVQQALVPLEQEVNRLIALHSHLWQQPFAGKWHDGRLLLWRCLKKICADLENIFTFFISRVEACSDGEKEAGCRYVWDGEIRCEIEMAEYKAWQQTMVRTSRLSLKTRMLPRLFQGFVQRLEERYSLICKA